MKRATFIALLAAAALPVLWAGGPAFAVGVGGAESPEGQWRFRVLLDGKDIGFHHYDVVKDGERLVVETRAEFDVKIFFFNAYRYRHSLKATWQGRCLESLESDTDANGEAVSVVGQRSNQQFLVVSGESESALPACVMNFAYWDPQILEQSQLLNPQTGEYLDVTVSSLGEEEVTIGGLAISANAYRIIGKDLQIDLWYTQDGQRWIALESLTGGDRVIRYERENYHA